MTVEEVLLLEKEILRSTLVQYEEFKNLFNSTPYEKMGDLPYSVFLKEIYENSVTMEDETMEKVMFGLNSFLERIKEYKHTDVRLTASVLEGYVSFLGFETTIYKIMDEQQVREFARNALRMEVSKRLNPFLTGFRHLREDVISTFLSGDLSWLGMQKLVYTNYTK